MEDEEERLARTEQLLSQALDGLATESDLDPNDIDHAEQLLATTLGKAATLGKTDDAEVEEVGEEEEEVDYEEEGIEWIC